jgi:uncharacterized membrane protein YbaN (DUF454 family)
MTTVALRISRIILGCLCLILGVIGLFLPFLQGILFIVIGLTLLSSESDHARRLLEWLRARLHLRQNRGDTEDGFK